MNIVWFKRDLRLQDNEALYNAIKSGKKTLLLYIFEPILINNSHYSIRHFDFIKQSLSELQESLLPFHTQILVVKGDALKVFKTLKDTINYTNVFSHQETGIKVTFDRDKELYDFFKKNNVNWIESVNNGVQRGISNREKWKDYWNDYMNNSIFEFKPNSRTFIKYKEIENIELQFDVESLKTNHKTPFQKGGRKTGIRYLNTFLENRYLSYSKNISKPETSRKSCSRLSPYIAWGNLSIREIYQSTSQKFNTLKNKRAILNFMSRLRWQAHFIQKFEMECEMEFTPINKGFTKLEQKVNKTYHDAWVNGKTGIPLIDASMRCLNETGYLNFRMRAMLVSFYTHNLWQPWKNCVHHLAQMFLDFEPGIHYPQIQMQAGITGVNTVRVYNPVKNAMEHDSEGVFVKKWVPELKNLPLEYLFEPWKMTQLEQELYNFKIGINYNLPIVDLDSTRKFATNKLWEIRKSIQTIKDSKRIIEKHTFSNQKIN